jgi:catechol 2,3-dioxygenase-like lactoylglutathione lyase family enzyme
MKIAGWVFVGTRTSGRAAMTGFVQDVLGLALADVPGVDADVFVLPDGSSFAVTPSEERSEERTVGFLVEDLDSAVAELGAAGVDIDREIATNARFRYVHFRAPDGTDPQTSLWWPETTLDRRR